MHKISLIECTALYKMNTLVLLRDRSFFMSMGGAGGIWLIATTKLYDPPLACNFFPHAPPPKQKQFFLMTPPPLLPNQKQIILLTLTKRLCTVYVKDKFNCYCDFFTVLLKRYRSLLRYRFLLFKKTCYR